MDLEVSLRLGSGVLHVVGPYSRSLVEEKLWLPCSAPQAATARATDVSVRSRIFRSGVPIAPTSKWSALNVCRADSHAPWRGLTRRECQPFRETRVHAHRSSQTSSGACGGSRILGMVLWDER